MDGRVYAILIIFFCSTAAPQLLRRQKRIVGGRAAAQPPPDDPVVYVTKNDRYARIYGTRDPDEGFYVFRGIRFAEPPVGQHRFQRPIPTYLEGEINATKWASPCPQSSSSGYNKIVGSEDCLFLNVFTPMLPDSSDGYPVLIWIHGGGFTKGAACQYEMRNLIKKRMVVVSIQYRLGSLGFLSTGTRDLPGNNGMFDMMLAINWVKDYIEYFGGNPNKIIPFGHGTGASSAFMLSVSKFSRNAFSGLIAMSGSILSHFAIDRDPSKTARRVASKHGCPTTRVIEMVRCLQEVPVEELVQVDSDLENLRIGAEGFVSSLSNLLGPGPVIEGNDDERSLPNFITETPEDSLKFGNFPSIPLLTGVMKNEMAGAIFGEYRQEVEEKLRTIPNFLSENLVPTLQSTISKFGNGSQIVPGAFGGYFNVIANRNGAGSLSKVTEAMGDSLYNVPAFLTVDHWSKKAKTFLYSFDHNGKRNYGRNFLTGVSISDTRNTPDGVTCHGDDLGYIFGQNTITGERLPNLNGEQAEEDKRVEDIFTNMIAEFARNGEPSISDQISDGRLLSKIPSAFSPDTNSYISIAPTARIMNNFRYCEMGLWTGLSERLRSPTCNLFKTTLSMVEQGAKETVNTIGKPITSLEGVVTDFIPNSNNLNESKYNNDKNYKYGSSKKGHAELKPKLPSFSGIRFTG